MSSSCAACCAGTDTQCIIVAETARDEYLELNRMWLADALPRNSESRAVSFAIKHIKRRYPKVAWIQSFADERCSRQGVVYQACNFLYCGEHLTKFYEPDGIWYHTQMMTTYGHRAGPKARHLQANRDRATVHAFRQFRYIFFIKPNFRRRLRKKISPYPKPQNIPKASEVSRATRPSSRRKGRVRCPHDAPANSNEQPFRALAHVKKSRARTKRHVHLQWNIVICFFIPAGLSFVPL